MNISEDISQEELAVFLEETDEEIKLLDEDLVLIEKSGVTTAIIQEIFRAAHTLKGSSGMLGYEKMSRVAHAMETVLDMLRSGTLGISAPVTNALLAGLDMLKLLREYLVKNEDSGPVDVKPIMLSLEKAAVKEAPVKTIEDKKEIAIDASTQQSIQSAYAEGTNVYIIKVEIEKSSPWMAVRHFQLISELAQLGKIIASRPTQQEVEIGKIGPTMEMVFTSAKETQEIKKTILAVQEIQSAEVNLYDKGETKTTEVNVPAKSEIPAAAEPQAQKAAEVKIPEAAAAGAKKTAQTSESVRINVKLLDNLMNLIGEMVIDRNRIKQISKQLLAKYEGDDTVSSLSDTSTHMVTLVSQLQENILQARMLQIGTILTGFQRLVRDLAQKAGKKIELVIEGAETELDRSIIEQIRDPLLHIIRNSIDHGIENPEKRRQAGKSETGTILLKAYHEQGHILVCVSDDGGGIDVEKVKNAAVSKGYMSAEAVARLSHAEAQNLIFMNGLSTAEKVSEISGRGVGMDVVQNNISNIGGLVNVTSKMGQGTNIKLRLPLTLATIDGILVSSGGLTYVIPISAIIEILRVKTSQITNVMNKEIFRLRENVIPLVRLSQRFEDIQTAAAPTEEIDIVVIKVGDKLSGLAVDAVMEPQESVVKPLGKYMGSVKGVSGATIMGDGTVALILDAATLIMESQQ